MPSRKLVVAASAVAAIVLAGCSAPETAGAPPNGSAGTPAPATSASPTAPDETAATVVRFSRGSARVEVTMGPDTPAVRDFLSMLPLTLTVEEFSGREKIADLPRKLEYHGSPGSDPEDGDLIYFIPWGNLGFYYRTAGIGYSDQTLRLGTYRASRDDLARLEGQGVTVEVVR